MDNSREQFEEWIKAERPKLFPDLLETYPTRYSDPATERLWQSWQASRQAIEIDLPKACAGDEYFIDGVFQPMRYERDVERALSAAGLKIKGE